MVREPHRPIKPVFDVHVRGPDGVVDLIERPLIGNHEVLPQTSTSFDARVPLLLSDQWCRAMQIGGLRRCHGKATVVSR